MKKAMNQTTAVLVASVAFAASVTLAQAQAAVTCQWQFRSGNNPAAPETPPAAGAIAKANIAQGAFASAWRSGSPAYGGAQGVWDLGKSGVITLNNLAQPPGGSSQARLITLRVVQYQDGGIYDQLARVSVPGATPVGATTTQASTTPLGEWTVAETQWRVEAGTPADTVVIAGPEVGLLVDQVTVEMISATALVGPELSFRSVGSGVEISWPASFGQAVLEFNASISDSVGWTAVKAPVEVKDGRSVTVVGPAGSSRFYRLRLN